MPGKAMTMLTWISPSSIETVERLGRRAEAVIPILQAIQAHYRYLPREALERVCELTEITPATIAGVSTFYTQFRHQPGRQAHHQRLPRHGLPRERLRAGAGRLGAPPGNRRRRATPIADGLFTVEKVACLGCCTLAPVVQIDGVTYGQLTLAAASAR